MSDRANRDRLEALQLERRGLEEELTLTASRQFTAQRQTLLDRANELDAEAAPLAEQEQTATAELSRLREDNTQLRAQLRRAEEQSLPGGLLVLAPVLVAGLVWAFKQGAPPLALVGVGAFTVGLLLGARLGRGQTPAAWTARQVVPILAAALAIVGALFVGAGWGTDGVSYDVQLSLLNSELVEHLTWTHLVQLAALVTVLASTKESGRLPLVLVALAALIIAASWWQWVPPQHRSIELDVEIFGGPEFALEQLEWSDPLAARVAIVPSAGLLSVVALIAFLALRDSGRRHWLTLPLLGLTAALGFFVLLGANTRDQGLPRVIIDGFGLQALVGLFALQWVWAAAPGASPWRRLVLLFPISVVSLTVMRVLFSG